jgi:DNA-binding CsgD family transcriptional regulator
MLSSNYLSELRALTNTPTRLLFVLLTMLALVISGVEVFNEFINGEPVFDMLDDLALFTIALLVANGLLTEVMRHRRAVADLQQQLSDARGKLQQVDERSRSIGRQYREVMQKQFDVWALTQSEQEIVISLLKGLSFREIAAMRETREKTVRQQATGIYRKAGLNGRHELAAWFFEDLLDPVE